MSINFGNESEFLSSGQADYISLVDINETQFVVAYRDGAESSHGTARIGTVDGTDIAFGEKTKFLDTGAATHISVDNFSESGFIVAYKDAPNSNHGTARIGTISGTTISFGPASEFMNSGTADNISVASLSSSGFVVGYRDRADSNHGTCKIGTIDGVTISFGEETEHLSTGSSVYNTTSKLSESGFIIAYRDAPSFGSGTVKIGTVSGTKITFGGENVFNSSSTNFIASDTLDENTFIVAYQDAGGSSLGKARIGTVNGTSVIFGTEAEFDTSGSALYISVVFINPTQFVAVHQNNNILDRGIATIGTIDGTNITFSAESPFVDSGQTSFNSVVSLSGSKFVVGYMDETDSNHGTARVGTPKSELSSPLSVYGHEIIQTSGDFFVDGIFVSSASGDSCIYGHQKMASYWYPGNWEERVR